MFLEILSTLLRVLFVFSVLIIAFGLSFYILLQQIVIWAPIPLWPFPADWCDICLFLKGHDEKGFYSPMISMVRVSTMMLGEIDFLSTFLQPMRTFATTNWQHWQQMAAATWFLMIFAILMPILLMNLLIGLAVGDIETVRRNASMKRLTMQVDHHTELERRLPKQILAFVRKLEVYDYPNKKSASTYVVSFPLKSDCIIIFYNPSAPND